MPPKRNAAHRPAVGFREGPLVHLDLLTAHEPARTPCGGNVLTREQCFPPHEPHMVGRTPRPGPLHEPEVGLGQLGSPPSPRPSPRGRGRNAPSVLAICRRWVGVGSGVQCANGSGKSLPGISSPTGVYPSPTGAGEGGRWPDEGHHGRTNPGGEGARRADEGRGDGARFQSPGGAIGNSPPMHRWGFARITRLSPGGRKKCRPQHSLSPLAGLGIYVLGRIPAMNRGAIFGRPCGTGANGRLVEIRGRRISPSGWKFFPVCSRLPNRN